MFWRLLGNSGVFLFSVIQMKAFIYGPEVRRASHIKFFLTNETRLVNIVKYLKNRSPCLK